MFLTILTMSERPANTVYLDHLEEGRTNKLAMKRILSKENLEGGVLVVGVVLPVSVAHRKLVLCQLNHEKPILRSNR